LGGDKACGSADWWGFGRIWRRGYRYGLSMVLASLAGGFAAVWWVWAVVLEGDLDGI
jgi:hypothetical protein